MEIMLEKGLIAMNEKSAKVCSNFCSASPPTTAWQPFAVISFLLLFTLSLESLPLPIQAQIVPLTSLLALVFLPFITVRVRVTPLFKMVIAFAIFVTIHSVIALFLDITIRGDEVIRLIAWGRQVIGLTAGLSVFLVLRRTLISVSDRFIISSVIIGALPALGLALLNVLWGLTGSVIAGHIVTQVRRALIPLGFTAPFRASGLSLEPSHFAFYLVVVVIPICLTRLITSKHLFPWAALLGLILITIAYTFSITGFVVLLVFAIAGILFGPRCHVFAIAVFSLLLLVGGFGVLFPNNYAVWQAQTLLSGEWSLSITDRLYSTLGPFINSLSSYTLIGYGLGGTSTHFREIVPVVAQEDIAAVSWEGIPNLRTLIGRILAENGLIGLALFISILIVGLKELHCARRARSDQLRSYLLESTRVALVSLLVGITIGHGSFALPYLWFWLALIDSRYLLNRPR